VFPVVVRCTACQATYRLDHSVPAAGLRVRCPGCGHVFRVRATESAPADPIVAPAPAPAPPLAAPPAAPPVPPSEEFVGLERSAPPPAAHRRPAAPGRAGTPRTPPGRASAPPATPAVPRAQWNAERTVDLEGAATETRPAPQLETPPFQPGRKAAAPVPVAVATPEAPAPAPADTERQERARRLARVLVSDILVYNQEVRDRAMREGNLATALAGEVNKAWELYKSKVDPTVLRNTAYFKDALNEILAGGQKIF
jgi:predicted Zn finger-like uncharacterized protein